MNLPTTGVSKTPETDPFFKPPSHIGGTTLRRIGINAASLLSGDVFNRGVTFVIYALVARYCGTQSFGQLSIGLLLLYSFQVLASAGLPTLIVRDVAKNPQLDAKYLVNACAVVFGAAFISYLLLGLFVWASGYALDTSQIIMLLGLSILPWSLTLIMEAFFRAKERMHLILVAATPINFAKLVVSYYLLSQGHGVFSVALILLGAHASILLIQGVLLYRTLNSPLTRLDWQFCRTMLQNSWKFFGIDALVAVWASVNVILLSWSSGEAAVGVFAAAVQLLLPPGIALQAIVNSLFPVMCRRAEQGPGKSRQLAMVIFEILTFIAAPSCVLLWFGAHLLISLVYHGDGFFESALIVRIIVPSLLLGSLTKLLGQMLMSHHREGANLRIVVIDVVFNVGCGLCLIPAFGVVGAALTLLLTSLLDCGLHYLATRSLLLEESKSSTGARFALLWNTLASAVLMTAVLVVVGDTSLVWLILVGSTAFVASFAMMSCFSKNWSLLFREQLLIIRAEQ